MAAVNDVPQLVDKKGCSYAVNAPKLEPGKFNKWKKRMLCYLARMEPYYLKCIKDGPFQTKQLKVMLSLNDIMESVISCVLAKETWTDLVHSFKGASDTNENRIMDLKLEYQTSRANLPEKWLTFSQGLRNSNYTQTLDLADIYGSHFTKDCFSKTSEPSYKSPVNNYSLVSKGFQPKFTPKLIQSSSNSKNQADPKFQKDYKAEYKKMKAKLALLKASPLSSQNPKTFQPKNKGLITETFDWDEEEVFDEEEVTQVNVLIALADDELTVRKSHARIGE
ncbi:hypothetical protein Tco_0309275 [Tanacetum coccineum]